MQIDWLTVAAQIINFLVLVFLLKRFLYQPVLDAMARREARVVGRLEEAARREVHAEEQARAYERRLEALAREREARLRAARDEAEAERHRLMEQIRGEIQEVEARWRVDLARDREAFGRELRTTLAETALAIARRCLQELSGRSLEAALADGFGDRLDGIAAEDLEPLAAEGRLALVSAHALDDAARERLAAAVRRRFRAEVGLEFGRSEELVCGVELRGAGRAVGWNIREYVEGAARGIEDGLTRLAEGEGR